MPKILFFMMSNTIICPCLYAWRDEKQDTGLGVYAQPGWSKKSKDG